MRDSKDYPDYIMEHIESVGWDPDYCFVWDDTDERLVIHNETGESLVVHFFNARDKKEPLSGVRVRKSG